MHRSGTSAVTGMLQRLGVRGPKTVLPPDDDNLLGYGESALITSFHDRLLESAGSRWDAWMRVSPKWLDSPDAIPFQQECRSLLAQEFGDAPLFVVKDPRLCRLVPFWLRVLQAENITPAAVIAIRSPFEVARSLEVRNGFSKEQSLLIWLRHVLDAEVETRSTVRSFVAYRDLLNDWKALTNRMSAELRITWPTEPRAAETEVAEFLKPELRHHSVEIDSDGLADPLAEWLTRTSEALGDLLRSEHEEADARETLDQVKREFDRGASLFGPIIEAGRDRAADLEGQQNTLRQHVATVEIERRELSERISHLESERDALERRASDLGQEVSSLTERTGNLEQHATTLSEKVSTLEQRNAELARELAGAKHRVEALLQSASWRITGPLRAVARLFMGRS
jgi:hypothetical protein